MVKVISLEMCDKYRTLIAVVNWAQSYPEDRVENPTLKTTTITFTTADVTEEQAKKTTVPNFTALKGATVIWGQFSWLVLWHRDLGRSDLGGTCGLRQAVAPPQFSP